MSQFFILWGAVRVPKSPYKNFKQNIRIYSTIFLSLKLPTVNRRYLLQGGKTPPMVPPGGQNILWKVPQYILLVITANFEAIFSLFLFFLMASKMTILQVSGPATPPVWPSPTFLVQDLWTPPPLSPHRCQKCENSGKF